MVWYEELPERSLEPPEPMWEGPVCPVCGREADTFYKDKYGDTVGCDGCIRSVDPWEESA